MDLLDLLSEINSFTGYSGLALPKGASILVIEISFEVPALCSIKPFEEDIPLVFMSKSLLPKPVGLDNYSLLVTWPIVVGL